MFNSILNRFASQKMHSKFLIGETWGTQSEYVCESYHDSTA